MISKPISELEKEPVSVPTSDKLTHTLPNIERTKTSIPALRRLRETDEDTYEEMVCIWAALCLEDKKYHSVYRVGGAGDKGRDVLAIIDPKTGSFDLYQCKHYDKQLNYSFLNGEIGKLITYTKKGDYKVPEHYYLACPFGVSQSFLDLLNDDAKELKKKLKEDWEEVKKKVGTKNSINMDAELEAYIDSFDFSIVEQITPLQFVEDFKKSKGYYFQYFGGGFDEIKTEKLNVPDVPAENEHNYITNLYDAYTENAGHQIDEANVQENQQYKNHLLRSREKFYAAEEVRIASRMSSTAEKDVFEELKRSIKNFVGDEYDSTEYKDGFEKVKTVVHRAEEYAPEPSSMIYGCINSNVKGGICHHLSNEGEMTWKTKE